MSGISQENTIHAAETLGETPQATTTERDAGGWTIVSKPGAAVEISTRTMPDHIREAIARNLGIGTGQPAER